MVRYSNSHYFLKDTPIDRETLAVDQEQLLRLKNQSNHDLKHVMDAFRLMMQKQSLTWQTIRSINTSKKEQQPNKKASLNES